MPIEVKHGISPGAAGAAAFGGAQGAARHRAAMGGAAAATRLEAQRNALEAQARQAKEQREYLHGTYDPVKDKYTPGVLAREAQLSADAAQARAGGAQTRS